MEQVEETENDMLSLCLGFVIMQVCRFYISGEVQPFMPHVAPDDISQSETNALLAVSLVLCAATLASTRFVHREMIVSPLGSLWRRFARAVQSVSSMGMSWCLLFWGEWQVYCLGIIRPRVAATMIVALFLTSFSLMLIFLLDFLADTVERAAHAQDTEMPRE